MAPSANASAVVALMMGVLLLCTATGRWWQQAGPAFAFVLGTGYTGYTRCESYVKAS